MLEISAVSLSPDVNVWLVSSLHPRILHVFDRACNLINEQRDVLSIVTPQIGNGPFNLVIEANILFSKYCNIESPISIHDNKLILGDLLINTAQAKPWSPRPDWKRLHANRECIANHVMQLPMIAKHPFGTSYFEDAHFDMPLSQHPGLLDHQALPITQSPISHLSSALVNVDIPSARKTASQLGGLGIGLTPAGDDFILGALYAAWIIHPPETASILAEEIVNTAAPLTTSLSAAWLRSVGKGEAGILWYDFFEALLSSNPMQIQLTINKILAVGETSGADALAGFVAVFAHLKKKINSNIG